MAQGQLRPQDPSDPATRAASATWAGSRCSSRPTACTFNAGAPVPRVQGRRRPSTTRATSTPCSPAWPATSAPWAAARSTSCRPSSSRWPRRGVGNEEQQAAFLRGNAYLGLVFLTDEDDCSAAAQRRHVRRQAGAARRIGQLALRDPRATCAAAQNLSDQRPRLSDDRLLRAPLRRLPGQDRHLPEPDRRRSREHRHLATDRLRAPQERPAPGRRDQGPEGRPGQPDPRGRHLRLAAASRSQPSRTTWPPRSTRSRRSPIPTPPTRSTRTVYDYWPVCYDPDHLPSSARPGDRLRRDGGRLGRHGRLARRRVRRRVRRERPEVQHLRARLLPRDEGHRRRHRQEAAEPVRRLQAGRHRRRSGNGVQADCRVVLRAPHARSGDPNRVIYQEILPALAQCPPGATNGTISTDCWQLVQRQGACPTNGQLVTVLRTAAEIAATAPARSRHQAAACSAGPVPIRSRARAPPPGAPTRCSGPTVPATRP